MTERVHLGVAALEAVEVLEWVAHEEEKWEAPGQVQALEGNACAQNAKRLLLMKLEHPVTLRNVRNAVHRWYENEIAFG